MADQTLISLFTSKLVVQLRADLEEAKRERDYFRGKVDRLEERLYGLSMAAHAGPTKRAFDPSPVGRKTWAQVQKESFEQQKRDAEIRAAQEKEAKAAGKTN